MPAYNPLLTRLADAWRELLKKRASAPAGCEEKQRLDQIYLEAKPVIEKMVAAETEGEIALMAHRALHILWEFDVQGLIEVVSKKNGQAKNFKIIESGGNNGE